MLWFQIVSLVSIGQAEISGLDINPKNELIQTTPSYLDVPVRVDDVEVRARRGASSMPPEIELDGAEIDAIGAWDIGEVLKHIGETLNVGDEPLVIINGKRVAMPNVFSGFPPDALVRAEILPPEATAIYGGGPGQRVVNLVLQRRFSSYDGRLSGSRPTQGGTSTLTGDLRRSAITGENTYQLGFRTTRDTALRVEERERDLAEEGLEVGGGTIRPSLSLVSVNASLIRPRGNFSSTFSLNGQMRKTRLVASIGGNLVESYRRNESAASSAGLTGAIFGWALQTNLNAQSSRSQNSGFNETRNEHQSLSWNTSVSRTLANLSAGPLVANLSGNLSGSWSDTRRGRLRTTTTIQTYEGRGSLAIPLVKNESTMALGHWIGDLHASLGASIRETSGGGGDEVNVGLFWTPRKGVSLNAIWAISSESVLDTQRTEPLYYDTPRVVFDFRAGEAVEIIPILGGNPDLISPRSERLSLMASLGPFSSWKLTGNLGFQRFESTDGIASLPELTEDVEAAFPEHVHRDPSGRLISIDYRPMNLSSSLTEGLNSSLTFTLPRPTGPAAGEATMLRFTLTYNLGLKNSVTFLAGQPSLDRLNGDGGGVAKQDARIMLDARRGRWGLNASARWQDGYRTRRFSGMDSAEDLLTDPFTEINLKLSFQMRSSRQRIPRQDDERPPRRRSGGLQLNLEVENLFDDRPSAHLGDGSPAPGYGRNIQDPIGRTLRLTFQKRF